MMVVGACAGMVFYLDRQALAVLKSTISNALNLSNADYALLISAYMVPYTLCYLVSGRLIDRWGTQVGATFFLALMGISTLGCALARSTTELGLARALLGAAESGISPATILMMTAWFPAARRAFALTACQSLQAIAPIAAPPLMAWLVLRGDWRWGFGLPAILSFGVAVLWWLSDRPENRPAVAAPSTPPALLRSSFVETFKTVFRNRALRAVIIARIVSDPFYFFLNYWHTAFLQEHAHFSIAAVGRLTWIPWVVVPLANIAIAAWSDRQAGQTGAPAAARSRALRFLACLAPAAAVAPFVAHSSAGVLVMITLSLFMTSGWIALSGVLVSELAPAGTVATTIGVLSALSGVASILFNQLAGTMVDHFGYTALFVVGACLHPLAAWVLWRARLERLPAA